MSEVEMAELPDLTSPLATALRELKLRGSAVSFETDTHHPAGSPYQVLYARQGATATEAQLSLGVFSHLNTDPDTAQMWTGFGKPWTAVMGFGSLFLGAIYAPLFDSTLEPSKQDELAILDFLDRSLTSDWKVPTPFAINFGEALHIQWNEDKTAFAVNFIVTVPCSEETWQRVMHTKQLELRAATKLQEYMTLSQLQLEQRLAPGSDSIN